MRSFIAVATGVLLLVCASFAAPSVLFPKGFTVPEGVPVTGEMLYHSLAHSQKTLPHGVDISRIATNTNDKSGLVGVRTKNPASLVIIPEELAPQDSVPLTDNAFPLTEMSFTLSTGYVAPGMSDEMQIALESDGVSKLNVLSEKLEEVSYSLYSCGVSLDLNYGENSFVFNKASFDFDAVHDVLYASSVACSSSFENQVTVVDLRSAYRYAKENYGAESAQVEAVVKLIHSVMKLLSGETVSFVIASNSDFSSMQRVPDYGFTVVSPRLTAMLARSATERKSDPDTGIFQIILWFTIFIVVVVCIFTLLTCGVGVDIEKDTLLYQTTALRGQPVL